MAGSANRFNASSRAETVFESYAAYFKTDMPETRGRVSFNDGTVELQKDGSLVHRDKSIKLSIYMNIPTPLTFELPEHLVLRMRRAFATFSRG